MSDDPGQNTPGVAPDDPQDVSLPDNPQQPEQSFLTPQAIAPDSPTEAGLEPAPFLEDSPPGPTPLTTDAAVLAASKRRTRRAFLTAGAAAAAAYGFYHWLDYGPQQDMLPALLDKTYNANATLSRTLFREHALAPTYPLNRAE